LTMLHPQKEKTRNRKMIKRYDIVKTTDGQCLALETPKGKYCILWEIVDSLIEWHDLRENPDDLPIKEDYYLCWLSAGFPEAIYWGKNKVDEFYWQSNWINEELYDTKVTHWAYFKPPLTHKEQSK